MEGFVCFLLVAALIAWMVWSIVQGKRAENHEVIDVKAHPGAVTHALTDGVGLMWRQVPGDGQLNFQRRMGYWGGYEAPVLSVDLEPLGNGTTRVELWMSRWQSKLGFGIGTEHLQGKRARLIKALETL